MSKKTQSIIGLLVVATQLITLSAFEPVVWPGFIQTGSPIIPVPGVESPAFSSTRIALDTSSNSSSWIHTFGGQRDDFGLSVKQTYDGGYIVAGETFSFGQGSADVYLIKTDAEGKETWSRTFGGTGKDAGNSVDQTSDGGYIVAGSVSSFSKSSDIYLIRTDPEGQEMWSRTFGGDGDEEGNSVQQTLDGGYILAGYTRSFGKGGADVYLIKTDGEGKEIWSRTFGRSYDEIANSVRQTSDGGYIVAGYSAPYGTDGDIYVIKADTAGKEIWSRTFIGNSDDYAMDIQQTSDDGYIVVGAIAPAAGKNEDVYLLKMDSEGKEMWNRTFGTASDIGNGVQPTFDGGYIIVATTGPLSRDVYLIKTDAKGNELWSRTFGTATDAGNEVQQTADGGYIIAGYTSESGQGYDIFLIKTDAEGKVAATAPFQPSPPVQPTPSTASPSANLVNQPAAKNVEQSSGGDSRGWIVLLAVLGLIVLIILIFWLRNWRGNQAKIRALRHKVLLAKKSAASGINEINTSLPMLEIKIAAAVAEAGPDGAVQLNNRMQIIKDKLDLSAQKYSELAQSAGDPENPQLGAAELGVLESEYLGILTNLREARQTITGLEEQITAIHTEISGFQTKIAEVKILMEDASAKLEACNRAGLKTDYSAELIDRGNGALGKAQDLAAQKLYSEGMRYAILAGGHVKQALDLLPKPLTK
jgi:Domain of unknown function (DUF5122) beta-propeller